MRTSYSGKTAMENQEWRREGEKAVLRIFFGRILLQKEVYYGSFMSTV